MVDLQNKISFTGFRLFLTKLCQNIRNVDCDINKRSFVCLSCCQFSIFHTLFTDAYKFHWYQIWFVALLCWVRAYSHRCRTMSFCISSVFKLPYMVWCHVVLKTDEHHKDVVRADVYQPYYRSSLSLTNRFHPIWQSILKTNSSCLLEAVQYWVMNDPTVRINSRQANSKNNNICVVGDRISKKNWRIIQ